MEFRYPLFDNTKLLNTLRKRVANRRNWLSISGEPLNIPLIAPPIDPRQLSVVRMEYRAAEQRVNSIKADIAKV